MPTSTDDNHTETNRPIPYRAVDVHTGALIEEHATVGDSEFELILQRLPEANKQWSEASIADRAQVVHRIADLFRERSRELGECATKEMGKPIGESVGEADFCGDIFAYYADNAEKLAADLVLDEDEDSRTIIQSLPVGTLLGIMPWNYPFYQIARFVAPNLMLGNTIILKHAESVPGCALAVEDIVHTALKECGFPESIYQNAFINHDQVSQLIEHPLIQGVSLTGSERAGARVAQQAGAALKKAVLELGGNDPYVILSTDDVSDAVRNALAIRLENTGQACNSNKRIIVSDDIFDQFLEESIEYLSKLTPNDPMKIEDYTEQKQFGPLSSAKAVDTLLGQIEKAKEAGATLHCGGKRVTGEYADGFYIAPAVITGIPVGSDIYYEEFFGPVVQIYSASSDEEALELANDTQYGLGSTVFAVEEGRAEEFAKGLKAGMTGVNQSAPETESMPFGGIKRSGYGRELGPLGMNEFVNKRLYSVKKR